MDKMDKYLEIMYKLVSEQNKNEKYKFQLFEILNIHIGQCLHVECICKLTTFKDKKDNVNTEDVYILIEQLFQRNLKTHMKNVNRDKSEYQYLKYITYLARIRNRPTKAYYELKKYISTQQTLSLYFDLILRVLSSNIESQMMINQKMHQEAKIEINSSDQINEDLDQLIIPYTDQIKDDILPVITAFLQNKLSFWRQLLDGNYNLSSFCEIASNVANSSRNVQRKYAQHFSNLSYKANSSSNIILSKIIEIFKCTVLSDYVSAYKFSSLCSMLLSRDMTKPFFILNCYNILKGDVQFIRTSLSKNYGKILNKKSQKLANFFGYQLKDFNQVDTINNLMPSFIGSIHNQFINNMVQRGFSPIIQNKITTFLQNKQGFIEPINLYIQNCQEISNDYMIQAVLLKLVSPKEYIVFDDKGYIQGITSSLFHLLFKKRDKYEGKLKQLFHVEGPHPNIGENVIELQDFQKKFNIYLLIPQMVNIIKKYSLTQQYAKTMQKVEAKKVQTKINIMLDSSLVDNHATICTLQNADIHIPLRIFHLNNQFSKIQNTPSKMNFIKSKNDEASAKSIENIEAFLQSHKIDWIEEYLYSQLATTFNLTERQYTYQDENQKLILKKTIYILEIIEQTDITLKHNEQQIGFQRLNDFNDKSESQNKTTDIPNQIQSAQDQDNQLFSFVSGNSFQEQNQTLTYLQGEDMELGQHKSNIPKLNNRDSNGPRQRNSQDTVKKVESQLYNQIINKRISKDKSIEIQDIQQKTNKFLDKNSKTKIIPNKNPHQLIPTQFNPINQQSVQIKQLPALFNNEDIRGKELTEPQILLSSPRENFRFDIYNEKQLIQNIPLIEMNNTNLQISNQKSNNNDDLDEQDYYLSSINSNRIITVRDKNISNKQEEINQQNVLSILSPFQITSNDNLISSKEMPSQSQNNEGSFSIIQNKSKKRIEKLRESLNCMKNDSFKSVFQEEDIKSQSEEGMKQNKLYGSAKKIMKLEGKPKPKIYSNNGLSSSSKVDNNMNKVELKKKLKDDQNLFAIERASQSQPSLGSRIKSYGQQIISEIITNQSKTNTLLQLSLSCKIILKLSIYQLFFILKKVIFLIIFSVLSLIFYSIISSFLTQTRVDLYSSYSTSFSQVVSANLTETSYDLFLMMEETPIIELDLILELSPSKAYSCFYLAQYYHEYVAYIQQDIENFANRFSYQVFNLIVFSDRVGVDTQMKYQDIYRLQAYNGLRTCQIVTPTQLKIDFDGLYFLIDNFIKIYDQTYLIVNKIIQIASKRNIDLIVGLEQILYISIGFCSCCFLLIIFIIKRINFYQEKVLLLVSRISYFEIENEATKLENCLKYLTSSSEDWMKTDFITLTTIGLEKKDSVKKMQDRKSIKSNIQTKLIPHKEIYDNHTNSSKQNSNSSSKQKNISSFNNEKKMNSNKKQKILSSSFQKRRLPIIKQILLTGSFFTFSCLFIGIGLVLAKLESSGFEQTLNFYYNSLQSVKSISSIIVMSELLLTQIYIENKHPTFIKSDFTTAIQYFQQSSQDLQNFSSSFMDSLSSQNQIQQSYKDQIFLLLQKDFCSQLDMISTNIRPEFYYHIEMACSSDSYSKEFLNNGVMGIINNYLLYSTSLNEFFLTAQWVTDNQGTIEKMKSILNQPIHVELIMKGFNLPLSAFLSLLEILNIAYKAISDKYIHIFDMYFLLLGPFLSLLIIILTQIYIRSIHNQLIDINFTLTFIPYERLQDENTLNILKQLKQFQ